MKIGLYFGSFNPIHTGHLIIAQHALQSADLQEVWFVVSPQNPFKNAQTLLNEQHRINLVRTAIEGSVGLKASSVEFKLPNPSYTSNTLVYLKEQNPKHEFVLLMGSDGFQNIAKWHNAGFILHNYEIYVYKRPGFEINNSTQARLKILDAPLLQISSTHIRELIAAGKSIRFLVPDQVKEVIENNHYYESVLENPAKKKAT